jgi:hypothetical protein
MPFVPVPNTAKVALLFTQFGQKLVSTLWFEKASAWSSADLTTLATAVNSWAVANLLAHMNNSVSYNGCEAVDMSAPGSFGAFVPETPAVVGAGADTPLPSNVTAAVKFLTGLTGRSHRGRNFWVGLGSTSISGDTLVTTAQTSILGAYNALGSYLVGLATSHVVASLYSGIDSLGKPIPRTTGVTTPVVSYAMDTALDSMRRRLIGRGD